MMIINAITPKQGIAMDTGFKPLTQESESVELDAFMPLAREVHSSEDEARALLETLAPIMYTLVKHGLKIDLMTLLLDDQVLHKIQENDEIKQSSVLKLKHDFQIKRGKDGQS